MSKVLCLKLRVDGFEKVVDLNSRTKLNLDRQRVGNDNWDLFEIGVDYCEATYSSVADEMSTFVDAYNCSYVYCQVDNCLMMEGLFGNCIDTMRKSGVDVALIGTQIRDIQGNIFKELFTEQYKLVKPNTREFVNTTPSYDELVSVLPRIDSPFEVLSIFMFSKRFFLSLLKHFSESGDFGSREIFSFIMSSFQVEKTNIPDLVLEQLPLLSIYSRLEQQAIDSGKFARALELSNMQKRIWGKRSFEKAKQIADHLGSGFLMDVFANEVLQNINDYEDSEISEARVINNDLLLNSYNYCDCLPVLDDVDGFLVPGQEEFLFNKVRSLPENAKILEIGCCYGRSTVIMAAACYKSAKRITVNDTWLGMVNGGTKTFGISFFDRWKKNLDCYGLLHCIENIHKGFSNDILPEIAAKGEKFDFIFIDASHHYVDIIKDFETAYQLVNEGGWIALHDVEAGWPGPLRVWKETASCLLVNHEYCSTLACGQKISGKPFSCNPGGGNYSYAEAWIYWLEHCGDPAKQLVEMLLNSRADNASMLEQEEEAVTVHFDRFFDVLTSMMSLEAKQDSFINYVYLLLLVKRNDRRRAVEVVNNIKVLDNFFVQKRIIPFCEKAGLPQPSCESENSEKFKDCNESESECESVSGHCNKDYFDWQKSIEAFGGKVNLFKFVDYINPDDTVIDFGCGGGFLLYNIDAVRKIGIDINSSASGNVHEYGIEIYNDLDLVSEGVADVVVSNQVLGLFEEPLTVLRKLKSKLKLGGEIVFVVNHEDTRAAYNSKNTDMHLYVWNQQTLGNLFKIAGFAIQKVETIQHTWPPDFWKLFKSEGVQAFHISAVRYARENNIYQVRVVARKMCECEGAVV